MYFGGLRYFYNLQGIGKIDAEWTNEAEAVYRRLFIAKNFQVKTTGLAGGLHLPYKGILLAVLVSTLKSLPTAYLFPTAA